MAIFAGLFGPRPGFGAWREYVVARVRSLEAEAFEAAAERGIAVDATQTPWVATAPNGNAEAQALVPVVVAIGDHLAEATRCVSESGGVVEWLSGQRVEGAWFSVHHAEAMLVTLLSPAIAAGRIPDITSVVQLYLPKDDPRRTRLEHAFPAAHGTTHAVTAVDQRFFADTLRAAYFLNAVEYSRVRTFRNVMLVATLVMTVIVGTVLAVGSRSAGSVPLCFSRPAPTVVASQTPQPTPVPGLICPSGDAPGRTQHGGDVLLVGLIGLIGAGLAAARALTTANEVPTRYSPAIAQALLKLPTGVATAILGIVALRAGFVPGVGAFDDQADILVWALLFGFAQQVLTGLIDDRGQQLLSDASPATAAKPAPAATTTTTTTRRRRH